MDSIRSSYATQSTKILETPIVVHWWGLVALGSALAALLLAGEHQLPGR